MQPAHPSARLTPSTSTWWRCTAAVAVVASAALHALAAAEHAEYWTTASRFFIALQLVQTWLGLALLLDLRARTAAWLVLVVNAGTTVLWVFSRTFGLPFGPQAGVPEAVGHLDLAVTLLQVLSILVVLRLLSSHRGPRGDGSSRHAQPAAIVLSLLMVFGLTAWGLTAPGEAVGDDGHPEQTHESLTTP